MPELTPEEINEIKNAVKPFTPEEIAEGKAERDALWAAEVVAEANAEAEPEPEPKVGQGAG